MMLLAFDIGNTNMVVGVYQEQELLTYWRIAPDKQKTADEFGILLLNLFKHKAINPEDIEAVVYSSVVPPLTGILEEMAEKYLGCQPIVIGPGIKTGISIMYDNPRDVGADRIVNAVAAFEKYGGPLIIVDFSTATTFCCISGKGEYLGGVISPGVNISTEALFQKTAKLPKVELITPQRIIGKNNTHAIQSGILYGYAGLVDGIVKRMKKEIRAKSIKVIATGSLAELIAENTETIDQVDKLLTLEGLRIIYERNK